ncbi:MAG: oligosaccharide repeat unit polymerase [Armatimonadetes bacterium]|nr:oligosaccharide repeat unit polymerase [Armatimonadota bacterium]
MHWLFLIVAIAHQAWIYRRHGRIDPFAVTSLIDVAIVLLLFVGSLLSPLARNLLATDVSFGLTLLVGQIALYAGLYVIPPNTSPAGAGPRLRSPSRVWLIAASVIYLLASLAIAKLYSTIAGISILDWLLGERVTVYSLAKSLGFGMILNYVMTVFQVGLLILIMVTLQRKRWLAAGMLYAALFVGVFMMFTTRLQLLVILMLPAFYFHYHVRRLTMPALAALAAGFVLMAAFFNMLRGGGLDFAISDLSEDKLVRFSSFGTSTYFVEPMAMLYTKLSDGDVDYEYGKNYSLMWLTFIPRDLWPEKPLTAFENRMTVELFGSQFDPGGTVQIWTFTAWGEGFAQFDVAGVGLNLFLYGVIIALARRFCASRPHHFLVWCYFLMMAAVYLRAGFQALAFLFINMIVVAAIYDLLPRIRLVWKAERSPASAGGDV